MASLVLLPVTLALPPRLSAQGTTAAIQGTIADATGPLPGAIITARDTQTGFSYEAVSDARGGFNLSGLRPAVYEISVAMNQYKPQAKTVQVLVGQAVTANFKVDPDVIYTEAVEVVGSSRLVQTRSAEISTTVTTDQMRYFPRTSATF
jgi:PPE-repeat protein